MSWLIDNWYIALALLVLGIFIGDIIVVYFKLPREEQIAKIKEFLKYAVLEAEKELGAKTGQAKLSKVYGMFVQQMPWLARLISFEEFSLYVDEALEWLRHQLSNNKAISEYVDIE